MSRRLLLVVLIALSRPAGAAPVADPFTVDYRYAPPWWQTAICLPDDWQKTLVGKDGSLLYDYPGKYSGFGTKITAGLEGETQWVRQELASPRVPIVRTLKQAGDVTLTEEAFAVAPPLPAKDAPPAGKLVVERQGEGAVLANWASPPEDTDPAFRSIAVGWNQPVAYRFRAAAGESYTVVFGLCEGWHPQPGQRILDLQVEGKTLKRVDMVAEKGRNVPACFAFDARDENGDGWVDVAAAAAQGSPDTNAILNVLWVFRRGEAPKPEELVAGRGGEKALARVECGSQAAPAGPPRNDVLLLRLRNAGKEAVRVVPTLTIESQSPIVRDADQARVQIGAGTLFCAEKFEAADESPGKLVLRFAACELPAGGERALAFGVGRGRAAAAVPATVAGALALLARAERFWREAALPYGHLEVPDAQIQALLDSSIRNIYQAREIKGGLLAFQVGPTCYRGLWVVDGSFLLDAVTMLGRADEARSGIRYLLGFQRKDGGIMLIDGHWKETGIALWAVSRHARLTGDKKWLAEVWPKVEQAVAFIQAMRKLPPADAPNAGLVPDGFSDGGLAGRVPEYTNVYWTLVGLRAIADAARWLGKEDDAAAWQREYDDFTATFRKAAERDTRTDAHGNRYLPIRMRDADKVAPQKAQWGFLHAVYPGELFLPDDPLVQGNMAMLQATEQEGMVFGTGWLDAGIWNYFASFYGHAWLWLGQGQKAAEALYAFANHASPLGCWREEQMPQGKGGAICGDMPHNWASAEFIRLVRHLLVLERGDALHLCEGLPAKWARPGAVTRVQGVLTEFGPISMRLTVDKDGKSARLWLDPPARTRPAKIVLHLDGWSGRQGTMEIRQRKGETRIALRRG